MADDEGLREVRFELEKRPHEPLHGWVHSAQKLAQVRHQLEAYFSGELHAFNLPLKPQGTEFQQSVWRALTTIPYAQTTSYGQLAQQLDRPTASRAVGAANGRNPIPIITTGCRGCMRVISWRKTPKCAPRRSFMPMDSSIFMQP